MNRRPQTKVVLAMTADGKIADWTRSPARFGSNTDKAHLEKQISLVDGVIFGAETLRAYGTTLPISNPKLLEARQKLLRPPQPVHIVCSASGNIDRDLRFFTQKVPRWLLTSPKGAKLWQGKTEGKFEKILVSQKSRSTQINPKSIDWVGFFEELGQLGWKKLAVLGGGELVASLVALDLIDEFWLTVCPLILGGANAPTPIEGSGLLSSQAKRLELLSVERVGEEVFLHYRVQR